MKKLILLCMVSLISGYTFADGSSFWKNASPAQAEATGPRMIFVSEARYLQLDLQSIKHYLLTAPKEFSKSKPLILDLPMPDGSSQRFALFESSVMAPELSAKYPDIHTWAGQGIDDKTATIRIDITQWGFHSQVIAATGSFYIDPFNYYTTDTYIVYSRAKQLNVRSQMACGFSGSQEPDAVDPQSEILGNRTAGIAALIPAGDTLRTYRLALACTGEYAGSFPSPTIASTLARMVTSVNRVTGVYEREFAVRLNLVPKTDTLIFLNAATDPYTNNNGSTMLTQNQQTVPTRIGNGNYDIGHVFSTGGGGIAGLGVVCNAATKAKGVTGSPAPYGDAFDIDYVAHEMGHQFGGNHTFNCTTGSCSGNRNGNTAYEPGSGTTIMAYAGICGNNDNVQSNSDAYFHTISFDEIRTYTVRNSTGKTCGTYQATANAIPVITSAPFTVTVPKSTPFMLTGAATDADNDTLTYCWEQFDLGNSGSLSNITGNSPTFRSFNPSTSPTRYFPTLSAIINNSPSVGETLPTYPRTMHFRLTVRDNRAGGSGVVYDPTTTNVTVDTSSGPFVVTQPNTTGISWLGGSQQTITWNVAKTDLAPVSCSNVDILLSTDGGLTYPYTLATAVPNNGSYVVPAVPNVATTRARVMVKGNGNVFLDISNFNHTITFFTALEEENIPGETVTVYPNPAHDACIIGWSGNFQGKASIKIFDAKGALLSTRPFVRSGAEQTEKIDLSHLASGQYTIEIESGIGRMARKLLVQ